MNSLDKKWYVIRTYSGHENKVKAYIENEIAQAGLSDKVTSVIVPSEKVFEVKDGKKKSKTRTFFPGYILVEAVLDKTTTHIILNTPSVISFVGPKNVPAPLQASEIRRLIGKIEERKLQLQQMLLKGRTTSSFLHFLKAKGRKAREKLVFAKLRERE